jgi:hypothetical protein
MSTTTATAFKIGYNNNIENSMDQVLDGYFFMRQQQSNHNSTIDEEEQQKRTKLIQAATNRLRQKLLESKYETLMSEIVQLQSQLDIIKLETSTSLSCINLENIDHFEKKFENHKLQLNSIIVNNIKVEDQQQKENKRNNLFSSSLSSFTKSSFSSTLSSIVSTITSDEEPEEEEDYYAILGGQHQKRRKRQQHRIMKEEEKESNSEYSYAYTTSISDIDKGGLLSLHSNNDNIIPPLPLLLPPVLERNALDDTLSFLNHLASDTDDGGFRKDILLLLEDISDNNNYDNTLLLQQKRKRCYDCCFIKRIINNLISTSWKYIRFAIILTLAILINIKEGPF